jgi:acetolactate synthase-1/2/3 large subunit
MPTVADYLATQLKHAGVTIVYGLPGGENVEILDAIRRQNIEFMLVKNESSAIYMAGTHARLTGGIGVALTTLGPGATNAYVGLAHAYLDREPVLLITAQTDPHLIGTHTHQVLDLQACFAPVTRFTAELSSDNAASVCYNPVDHAPYTSASTIGSPYKTSHNHNQRLSRIKPHMTTSTTQSTSCAR